MREWLIVTCCLVNYFRCAGRYRMGSSAGPVNILPRGYFSCSKSALKAL